MLLDKAEDVGDAIRVSVTVVLTINKDHWNTTYGTGTRAKDVSDAVRNHFVGEVRDLRVFDEIDGHVEAKAR